MAIIEQRFKSVFTPYGKEVAISAYNGGENVQLSFMGIGDGNGEMYTPEFGQEDLRRQWLEIQINNISVDSRNSSWLIVEGIIPEDAGGHWIREVSVKDENHRVIALASVAETYKPVLNEGSTTASIIRVVLAVNDTEVFNLTIDTSIALVTRDEFLAGIEKKAPAKIALDEETGEDTDTETGAVEISPVAEVMQNIWHKIRQVVNVLGTKTSEAPIDGKIYGRRNGVWQPIHILNAFIDPRDNRTYRTTLMPDGKIWMAENLNWAGAGVYYGSGTNPGNAEPFAKAGRLYTYAEALTIAPPGWHLPSDVEWEALMTAIGGAVGGGTKLKSTSGWNESGNGTDEFQFTAMPGGARFSAGTFVDVGCFGYWWSASPGDAAAGVARGVVYHSADVSRYSRPSSFAFSVRCLKD